MRLIFACTTAYIISFSIVQSFNSNLYEQTDFSKYFDDQAQILKQAVNESNGYLYKEAQGIDPLVHDYVVAKIKQNIFKSLRKLTQSWKIVPKRFARQEEAVEAAGALVDAVSSSEQTIASIGAGFKIADTVIHSLVSILRTVFGGLPFPGKTTPVKGTNPGAAAPSQGSLSPPKPTTSTEKYFRDFRALDTEYYYIHNFASSIRDKSYSEQLSGALTIVTGLRNSKQLKPEMIKSTVDSILDIYVATNGKTQALFLPQLFDGIPRET